MWSRLRVSTVSLPRAAVSGFEALAAAFAAVGANAELAVPTMLRMLAASDAGLQRLPCWGFCCSSTPCPELLGRHACGHRMRLDAPRVRAVLSELWAPS